MPYALGAVKPHVKMCAETAGAKFGIKIIYGVGVRAGKSDHPKGLALDFMCDVKTGRELRAHLIENWNQYGILYLIHEQQILESPTGSWEKMENRGSATANHFDHVHASFKDTAAGGAITNVGIRIPIPGLPGGIDVGSNPLDAAGDLAQSVKDTYKVVKGLGDAFNFATDPKNWWRVFLFVLGGALLLVFIWQIINSTGVVKSATNAIGKAKKIHG